MKRAWGKARWVTHLRSWHLTGCRTHRLARRQWHRRRREESPRKRWIVLWDLPKVWFSAALYHQHCCQRWLRLRRIRLLIEWTWPKSGHLVVSRPQEGRYWLTWRQRQLVLQYHSHRLYPSRPKSLFKKRLPCQKMSLKSTKHSSRRHYRSANSCH